MELLVQQRYLVSGMTCAACARSVESLIKSTSGVHTASVNFATNSAVVEYNSAEVSSAVLHERLHPLGYDIVPARAEAEAQRQENLEHHLHDLKRRTIIAAIFSLPVMILGMSMTDSLVWNLVQMLCSAVVLGYAGRDFFVRAASQLRVRTLSMDSLVALSTGLAFVWSCIGLFAMDWLHEHGIHTHLSFESASVIVTFVLCGKYLEERARRHSGSALSSLQAMQPRTVMLVRDDQHVEAPVDVVRRGDHLMVRAGERIAVDGIVINGASTCDESMLSGESLPVLKETSSQVFAGTLNLNGVLTIEARSVGDDTMLAFIQRSVRDAQESQIAAQRLVDFVSSRFVPGVIVLSLITFAAWLFFGGAAAAGTALNSMIAVLIVACPCALGLAAPIALVIGIGRAAEHGILIKNADALERASTVTDVVFDKTGTLSALEPSIESLLWHGSEEERLGLSNILLSMELQSHHLYARAVALAFQGSGAVAVDLDSCEEVIGRGMKARKGSRTYIAGSPAFALEMFKDIQIPDPEATIVLARDANVLCSIRLAAPLQSGVPKLVQDLRAMHISSRIISGDREGEVARIALQAGIDQFNAQRSAMQKEEEVRELQAEQKIVAMVGDGVNDAQSLVRADVSFAMGRGSDTAAAVADIVLMNSDVTKILPALRLARGAMRIIRQNLVWAFAYNVLLIPLAAGALEPLFNVRLDPMFAGAAMALSSVSVVMNSLRLKTLNIMTR